MNLNLWTTLHTRTKLCFFFFLQNNRYPRLSSHVNGFREKETYWTPVRVSFNRIFSSCPTFLSFFFFLFGKNNCFGSHFTLNGMSYAHAHMMTTITKLLCPYEWPFYSTDSIVYLQNHRQSSHWHCHDVRQSECVSEWRPKEGGKLLELVHCMKTSWWIVEK